MRALTLSFILLATSATGALAAPGRGGTAKANQVRAGAKARALARMNRSPRIKAAIGKVMKNPEALALADRIWNDANPGWPWTRNGDGVAVLDSQIVGFERGKVTLRVTVGIVDLFGQQTNDPKVTTDIPVSGKTLAAIHEQLKLDEPKESNPYELRSLRF